ncbi:MAG: IS66 family insertion sequence element accessory protein TnpA [Pirellula sp.]|jgi:hypothetical protein
MDRLNRSAKAGVWQLLLNEQAASGLTARAFCIQKGLAVQSFYQWKRKLLQPIGPRDNPVLVKPSVQSLVPVRIVASAPKPTSLPIQIVTPSGFSVRVDSSMSPSEIAHLVASIEVSVRGESC